MSKDETKTQAQDSFPSFASPLLEVQPDSIEELANRIDKKLVKGMPHEITNYELDKYVNYLRSQRNQFIIDEANNIKPGRKAAKPKTNINDLLSDEDF